MTSGSQERHSPQRSAASLGALPDGGMADGERVPDDPQELAREIERTREQLGETVEQLAAKADVKRRARAEAAKLAGRVKATVARARGPLAAAGAAAVAVAGSLAVWRWRRR